MNLHSIDIVLILLYMGALFVMGLSMRKKKMGDTSYLLAARSLSLPAFIMTLVTTWYGAILGVGEFIFGFGVVGWVTNGVFWYVVYLFFGLYLAKKINTSRYITVADQLTHTIGKRTGFVGAVFTYIMSTPAPYIFSLGLLVTTLFEWPLWISISIGTLMSAIYIWFGGFRAVVRTDMFQFVFMYLGFGLLLFLSINTFGGWDFLVGNLPASHLSWKGELPIQSIVVWGLLALWTLVDPNFYQRCYAAKDAKTAQRGVFWSLGFWFLFDMLTLFTALYARAAFPDADPLFSYLVLADDILPPAAKGLFVVTLLSIIMSTIDSFLFASSAIMSHDFMSKKYRIASLTDLTKKGIVITLAVSLIFILIFKSVIGIIYGIGTIGVSALLLPVLISLFSKKHWNDLEVMRSMIAAGITAGTWLVYGWINRYDGWPTYAFGIEPMYIGLIVSASTLFILNKKK